MSSPCVIVIGGNRCSRSFLATLAAAQHCVGWRPPNRAGVVAVIARPELPDIQKIEAELLRTFADSNDSQVIETNPPGGTPPKEFGMNLRKRKFSKR